MLFPAALSGLASPVTLPGTELLLLADTSTSEGGNTPRQAWEICLASEGLQRRRRIKKNQQDSHRPWQTGTKRQNDTAKTRLGDHHCENPGKWRPGINGSNNRIQVQGTQHSWKTFYSLPERQTIRNPHSQQPTDTDLSAKDLYERNEKSLSQNSPSLPWTAPDFWKEKETCPQAI